jgi:tetratricopeptide (TPR) repeat protein
MQAQDAPSLFLFKLWPKIEENKNLIFTASGVILAGALIFSYVSWHGEQQENSAGLAITKVMVSQDDTISARGFADKLLAVANDHPGTAAALRAQLQAATALFSGGQYADAQAIFQKLVDSNPDTFFKSSAILGLAASLEAQGKNDEARLAYQRAESYAGTETSQVAKFALGRLNEQAGKFTDALNYYGQVVGNNEIANEAGLRRVALQAKIAASKPAPAAAAPTISAQPAAPVLAPVKPQ